MLEHGLIFLISLTCSDFHKNFNIHEDACNKTILASSHKVELIESVDKADKLIEAKIKPVDKTQATIYALALIGAKTVKEKKLIYTVKNKFIANKIDISLALNSESINLSWDLP